MRIEINKYIVADTEICGGTPTFKGTRIMVWQVLEMLTEESFDDILEAFPSLNYGADLMGGTLAFVPIKKY